MVVIYYEDSVIYRSNNLTLPGNFMFSVSTLRVVFRKRKRPTTGPLCRVMKT